MKFSEIYHLDQKELRIKLTQLKKELFDSQMKLKMQRLNNPLSLRFLRRDIARVQTVFSVKKKSVSPQTKERMVSDES